MTVIKFSIYFKFTIFFYLLSFLFYLKLFPRVLCVLRASVRNSSQIIKFVCVVCG